MPIMKRYNYRFKYQNYGYVLVEKGGSVVSSLLFRSGRGCTIYDGILFVRERGKEPVYMSFKPLK